MRIYLYLIVLELGFTVLVAHQAEAGIYTFTDSNGVIHFTTKSSDPRYDEMTPVPYPTWPVRLDTPARSAEAGQLLMIAHMAPIQDRINGARGGSP